MNVCQLVRAVEGLVDFSTRKVSELRVKYGWDRVYLVSGDPAT